MVFYRKYRPQSIDELDSEVVKKALQNVLGGKSIPHAFLFTGPKGLGKTSTARIVAKYVNCEKVSQVPQISKVPNAKTTKDIPSRKQAFGTFGTSETSDTIPCNQCSQCVSITNGTNIDVLEIDGASNRGIDEMRDLREKIRLLPVSAKMKVYIIDEVHMLTTEAFNALLKTLEEPPAHAMFLLCTTEPHKVPGTILSRCFHIQFKKATTVDLVRSFERIMQGEGIKADTDALELVASFAEGSFRDGAKILEEIMLRNPGKQLTKDMIESSYHVSTIENDIVEFLHAFIQKDTKKALAVIQRLEESGIDMKYFTEQLLFSLHTMLLQKSGVVEGSQKVALDLGTIRSLADVFSKAYVEMKNAVIPQLPLELAVVEWTGDQESRIILRPRAQDRGENQELRNENQEDKKVEKSSPVIASPDSIGMNQSQNIHVERVNGEAASQAPRSDKNSDKQFLFQLLDSVKTENHMLAGVLRSCRISNVNGTIHIEAPSKFHKEKLEDKNTLQILEDVCREIIGKDIQIEIVLK